MALKKCKDCQNEISTKAKNCPSCGAPQGPKQYNTGKLILGIIVVVVLYNKITGEAPATVQVPPATSTPPAQSTQPKPSFKTFSEADFVWDKNTTPHKSTIVAGVNKVHRENANCKIIDPSSAYLSPSKGTKSDPVFFVTCGTGASTFNAFFSKSEVTKGEPLTATKHIDKNIAIQKCEEYAKTNSEHPSTVSFSRVVDLSVIEHPNGNTAVTSTFTAKNSFNLEIKYNIRCLSNAQSVFEANISEAK